MLDNGNREIFWSREWTGHWLRLAVIPMLPGVFAAPAHAAGLTLFDDGAGYVKTGGHVQVQYHRTEPDPGNPVDDVMFRRLRAYVEGGIREDWAGKIDINFGATGDNDEITIKDAYAEYDGIESVNIKIGNARFPFSREYLTSSKYQQLVERTFVGDRNFGTPERNVGIHAGGHNKEQRVGWAVSAAWADIDPGSNTLAMDTPVNADDDFNRGWIVGGRLDFHPLGYLEFSQGDFSRKTRATFGVAAYTWENSDDGDVNPAGIDKVTAFEISGGVRGRGVSMDAQYNRFKVDTVDPTFTSVLYKNGKTTLRHWAIEGGYMVIPGKLELVSAYESQDANNYQKKWTRVSVGTNWYIVEHDIKFQLTVRAGDNLNGIKGDEQNDVFAQAQYIF